MFRIALKAIDDYFGGIGGYYGYDITIVTNAKNFVSQTSKSVVMQYRFLVPAKIVRQYKDKEISSQQVLDSSIILLDDDRIELQLR